jgi:hypothetical protein
MELVVRVRNTVALGPRRAPVAFSPPVVSLPHTIASRHFAITDSPYVELVVSPIYVLQHSFVTNTISSMNIDFTSFAKMGAQQRLQQLQAEREQILRAFPALRKTAGPERIEHAEARHTEVGARRRRSMTAAERRSVSARMKRYWASRREGKATAPQAPAAAPLAVAAAPRRTISAEGRARIAEAQKKRWAAKKRAAKR